MLICGEPFREIHPPVLEESLDALGPREAPRLDADPHNVRLSSAR